MLQSLTKLTLAFVLVFYGWQAVAANPIFVLNSQDANVSVIDPLTWTVKQNIPTGTNNTPNATTKYLRTKNISVINKNIT